MGYYSIQAMKTLRIKAFRIVREGRPDMVGWERMVKVDGQRKYYIQIVHLNIPAKIKHRWQLIIQKYKKPKKNAREIKALFSKTILLKHYKTPEKCFQRASRFFAKKKLYKEVLPKKEN